MVEKLDLIKLNESKMAGFFCKRFKFINNNNFVHKFDLINKKKKKSKTNEKIYYEIEKKKGKKIRIYASFTPSIVMYVRCGVKGKKSLAHRIMFR